MEDNNKQISTTNNKIIPKEEKNITDEVLEMTKDIDITEEEKEDIEKPKPKKISGIIIAIASLLILLLLIVTLYKSLEKDTNKVDESNFESVSANEIISEQENPPLKASKLDPTKAYLLKNATDTNNNLTITLTKIQFRNDQTRLWVSLKNTGSTQIQMMPNVNTVLVDNNGHSYKADAFAGTQITGIAPGTNEEIMLVFDPIRLDAKQITFNLNMVFDMKKPAWNIVIPVNIP